MKEGPHSTLFSKKGSNRLYTPLGLALLTISVVLIAYLFSSPIWNLVLPILLGATAVLMLIIKNNSRPYLTLRAIVFAAFFVNALTRVLPLPLGLSVDILILLSWLTIFFKSYQGTVDWSPIKNIFTYCLTIWALYCFLQLLNPLAVSTMAWFYASRGLALYACLTLPLIFLLFNKRSDMKWFINVWFTVSILMGLYGAKQYWFGLFGFEQTWLDHHGYLTHIIWGKFTRMFSFASDANQFGICQAHCGIVATIMAIGEVNKRRRLFFIATAIVTYYGMIISGTRAAVIVPGIGILIYLILSRNYRILIIGSIVLSCTYVFLAHTYLLNNIAPVSRMRSVFHADRDESYRVRLANREILKVYMKDKPFGGGIGSAGNWGNRFSPNTFLAEFETDGMYVRIYAETGIVGYYIYCVLYIIILTKMVLISWKLKTPKLRFLALGLTCGIFGIMTSNYSAENSLGLPTSIIFLWSFALVWMTQKWDKGEEYPTFGVKELDN